MWSQVVDVAGVPLGLHASDDVRARCLRAALDGFDDSPATARATITVDATRTAPPGEPPRSEMLHIRLWDTAAGIAVAASDGLVIMVSGTSAHAHLPELGALADFERCVYLPLTWVLARDGRFVLHGAAIVRDGRALLLLGHSGAGKSTLAAAALETGWQALADDLVIVDVVEGRFRVHGIHRTPAIPVEIGGALAASARRLDDPRDRAALPRGVLTSGGHPLVGVVLITHSDRAGGSLRTAAGSRVLPILLQSFAGSIDSRLRAAFFPIAGGLSRLPVWDLGHAADASARRARAAHHLERCAVALFARCSEEVISYAAAVR